MKATRTCRRSKFPSRMGRGAFLRDRGGNCVPGFEESICDCSAVVVSLWTGVRGVRSATPGTGEPPSRRPRMGSQIITRSRRPTDVLN